MKTLHSRQSAASYFYLMDVHHAPVNPYHPGAQHLQHPHQPLQQPNVTGFNQGFVQVPFPQHYYAQQGPPQGLNNTSYAAQAASSYNTAPAPNHALRYPPQQFSLPVHNGLPIQRRPTQPQHAPAPQVTPPQIAHIEPSNVALPSQGKEDKHLKGLRCIPEPADKDLWRQRLFDVDGLMILTEEQYVQSWCIPIETADVCFDRFQVYFPHVDNVYSHRSTQDYKKKPFVSHYYDCRLKGRPAGTPKSDDPNKKKRKRVARALNQCDVKIKITEYQPGATREEIATHLSQQPRSEGISAEGLLQRVQGAIGQHWQPEVATTRFYTIQRVNGTGANAKESEAGGHRHSLEESDRIKKNSIIRSMTTGEKVKRTTKPPVRTISKYQSICAMLHTLVTIFCAGVWDLHLSSFIATSFQHRLAAHLSTQLFHVSNIPGKIDTIRSSSYIQTSSCSHALRTNL